MWSTKKSKKLILFFWCCVKSEVTSSQREQDRDYERAKTPKRRATQDDSAQGRDDGGKDKDKEKGKGKGKGDPHRIPGYEDPKATGKDMGMEILDEVFNEGWI